MGRKLVHDVSCRVVTFKPFVLLVMGHHVTCFPRADKCQVMKDLCDKTAGLKAAKHT